MMNFQRIFIKVFALFSVVRGYNLAALALAIYLAAIFIFSQENHKETLLNPHLNLIVFAAILSVAAGYIINNFYDLEKDKIDKPLQVYVNRFINDNFKLTVYLILNILALISGFLVSYRVAIFFLSYQFFVWIYCHKINKIVILNNLISVILRVFPFFALLIYYNNYSLVIFFHAAYLLTLLLITEIIKDFSSKPADLIFDYKTLPIQFGERFTKVFVGFLVLIQIFLGIGLSQKFPIGFMTNYFYFSSLSLVFIYILLWSSSKISIYKILHLLMKVLIIIGVFSIIFIEINPLDLQEVIHER